MKTIYHSAESRGHFDHGWLNTYHTFSFAGYYDEKRTHFGVLRVLNDDTVQGGEGFGTHPHKDMEIISIPLEGALEHKDSTGTTGVIRKGEIQVMTAGTGVRHSEYNHNTDQIVKFLQIWIFPKKLHLQPRGEQMSIKEHEKKNVFQQIVSPEKNDEGLWINQDAWLSIALFDKSFSKEYKIRRNGNGVYLFMLQGSARIAGKELNRRDGLGVWETESISVEAASGAEILLIDVPMALPDFMTE